MKKLLLIIVLISVSFSMSAQIEKTESGMVLKTGVETDPGRLLVGAQWRYVLVDYFRFAADGQFLFPKNKVNGLNFNTNIHYTIEAYDKTVVYPFIGLAMQNNRYMGRKDAFGKKRSAKGTTDWGFNLGGGFEYYVSQKVFFNSEIKYVFGKADCMDFSVGVGFTL